MRRAARPRPPRTLALRACAWIALAGGCAWGGGPLPEPSLREDGPASRIDAGVEGAIAASLPEVSYETRNPAIVDPLGPTDPSRLVRRVETLDGRGRIVCLKRERQAFGECTFPEPATP